MLTTWWNVIINVKNLQWSLDNLLQNWPPYLPHCFSFNKEWTYWVISLRLHGIDDSSWWLWTTSPNRLRQKLWQLSMPIKSFPFCGRTSSTYLGFQRSRSLIIGHSSTITRWRINIKGFLLTINSLQYLIPIPTARPNSPITSYSINLRRK